MDTRLPYWGSIIFSSLALILLVVNISLANANHRLQADIQQRQATLSGGQQLSQLNQGLVQALGEAAVKNGDTQIRDLLGTQGITVKAEAKADSTDKK